VNASLVCPKCGFAQPAAPECARCGIVVARFRREAAPAPHAVVARGLATVPPTRSSAMPAIAVLVVLAGLAASAYGLMKAKGAIESVTAVAAPRRARRSSAGPAHDSQTARVEEPRSADAASPEPSREEVREGTPSSAPVSDRSSTEIAPAAPAAPGRQARRAISSSWREGASGFSDAESDRKRLGAPMAVYFFTDWCGWCRRFESAYLPSPEVEEYLNDVVRVRINPENGSAERALAEHGHQDVTERITRSLRFEHDVGGSRLDRELVARGACRDAE